MIPNKQERIFFLQEGTTSSSRAIAVRTGKDVVGGSMTGALFFLDLLSTGASRGMRGSVNPGQTLLKRDELPELRGRVLLVL